MCDAKGTTVGKILTKDTAGIVEIIYRNKLIYYINIIY